MTTFDVFWPLFMLASSSLGLWLTRDKKHPIYVMVWFLLTCNVWFIYMFFMIHALWMALVFIGIVDCYFVYLALTYKRSEQKRKKL